MRAVVMRDWKLRVDDVPDPRPGPGQILTRVLACGICGSDLHLLHHGADDRRLGDEIVAEEPLDPTRPRPFDPQRDVIMGHEFCCEVIELGAGVTNLAVGDVVVSMPTVFDDDGVHALGFSNEYPGGFAERMVLNELLAMKVPRGVPHRLAALTEPLAVGIHAVSRSNIEPGEGAIVLGLGPVGLACVAALRMHGAGPIVGSDFSPTRRELGRHVGCDEVVDPALTTPHDAWRAVAGRDGRPNGSARPAVVFEAVGLPGMIDSAMRLAPRHTRVVVVGACLQPDHFHPMVGVRRELTIRFALGYEPDEFSRALLAIADGTVDLAPLVTGVVDVDGVPGAFTELGDPHDHAKILVEPGS